jgi:serine/threonine-protein kinase
MRFIKGDSLRDAIKWLHDPYGQRCHPGERALRLRKLLGRLIEVCNTIAYAHSRGVLHRDIKPGNIMLGKYGETLVVDWGLAKAIGRPEEYRESLEEPILSSLSSGETPPTMHGSALGTPSYMSPEQAAGCHERLGPASDVYNLGATLYTILTGRAPFQDGSGRDLLERVARGAFPRPRAIQPDVPRPLEAICLKAMAHDPTDRYPSALALADDIERWLADEPIGAWREPLSMRASRWARRHRTWVTSACSMMLIGVTMVMMMSVRLDRERRRSDHRLNLAEKRADLALQTIGNFRRVVATELDVQDRPDLKPLREKLLREPQAFYRQLQQEFRSSGETRPDTRAKLAEAILALAAITAEVDSQSDAIPTYQEGIGLLDALAREAPADRDHRAALGRALAELGTLQHATGRSSEARASFERARDIHQVLVHDDPAIASYRAGLANAYSSLGALQRSNRPDEARGSLERARGLFEELTHAHGSATAYRGDLARTYIDLGALEAEARRPDGAVAAYEKARTLLRDLIRADLGNLSTRGVMVAACKNLGPALVALGRDREALEAYRDAVDQQRFLLAKAPRRAPEREALIACLRDLAQAQRKLGRHAEAAGTVAELRSLWAGEPREMYDIACEFSLCIPITREAALRRKQADQAMEALRQAISAGFKDFELMRTDRNLEPLRSRADFRQLVMDSGFPSNPFAR